MVLCDLKKNGYRIMTVYDIIFHGEICLHVAVGGLHTPTECVGELVYKKFEVITNITIWVCFFRKITIW